MRQMFDEDPSVLDSFGRKLKVGSKGIIAVSWNFLSQRLTSFLVLTLTGNEPIDFLKLYYASDFFEVLVNETNDYAETISKRGCSWKFPYYYMETNRCQRT